MINLWQTIPGVSVKRAKLLSESKVWIDTFRNDTAFRQQMLNLIKQDQLRERGVDSDGEVIGYYSFTTSLINPKKAFNTHFTLEDTGELFRSMFLVVTLDYFQYEWDDEKIRDQDWWSPEILGLTDENLDIISAQYFERLSNTGWGILSDSL